MHEVGQAMINAVTVGHSKNVLEIKDIRELAQRGQVSGARLLV